MIVKICYKKQDETPAVVFFEGDRIYKEYIEDSSLSNALFFINEKSNKKEFYIFVCRYNELINTIVTNETVYLLNNEGKTIERIN